MTDRSAIKSAVIAIGGNSLVIDPRHQTVQDQYLAAQVTCRHVARLITSGIDVAMTHGNGPQVGFILLRSDLAKACIHEVPLDSCVADTQGAIGYFLQQALQNELDRLKCSRQVVSIVTRVLVDPADVAFESPSKPICPFYSESDARRLEQEQGWSVREDSLHQWRRVVPSPLPVEIIEVDAVKALMERHFIVVTAGGGGIPVVRQEDGDLVGISAVVDKDRSSALLATELDADLLLISTAVEKVALSFGTPEQRDLERITVSEAMRFMSEGQFGAGSMLPKVEAAVQFLRSGGKAAIITSPEHILESVEGRAGTWIVHD